MIFVLYIPINAYLLVNFRTKKYLTDEQIVGYFAFYTDLFWIFWWDLLLNIKFLKKIARKRRKKRKLKKMKKQKEKEEKMRQDFE